MVRNERFNFHFRARVAWRACPTQLDRRHAEATARGVMGCVGVAVSVGVAAGVHVGAYGYGVRSTRTRTCE